MFTVRIRHMLSLLVSAVLALSLITPIAAWAAEDGSEVFVENHTSGAATITIFDITIDQVDEPKPELPLDDTATAQAAGDIQWEIPVLWVSDSMQIRTYAMSGESYLPVLAFFVPQEYSLEGGEFAVTLSPSLTKLFGGREVISVYNASTGITYILPASLRDLFADQSSNKAREESAIETEEAQRFSVAPVAEVVSDQQPVPQPEQPQQPDQPQQPSIEDAYGPGLIDIYCAQTARDAFSDEDLEYLLDLILNRLEPQAVELLLDKFPAFRAAADMGQIGREIGMYVYYERGDMDGVPEHEDAPSVGLAFVRKDAVQEGDEVKFCYLLGINLTSLTMKDFLDNPMRDEQTGKLILTRDGSNMTTLENTMVHELFHAFMNDYNRTGMIGATDIRDAVTDREGNLPTDELAQRYWQTAYPLWFVEGTASAVEHVWQYRYTSFDVLRTGSVDSDSTEDFSADKILESYMTAKDKEGNDLAFALNNAGGYDADGNKVDVTASRYTSGYLASVYLGELAARKTTGSSVIQDDSGITISAERIRMGLNSILERMHNGETLDQVINDISPLNEDGTKRYTNTSDFEFKFIRGAAKQEESGGWYCDGDTGAEGSLEFVTTYLKYFNNLDYHTIKSDNGVNGSILFDFTTDYESPLDRSKEATSDFFQIVESNRYVESTVPNEVALSGGGTSRSGTQILVGTSESSAEAPEDEVTVEVTSEAETPEPEMAPEAPAEPEVEMASQAEPETEPEPDALPDAA